MPGHPQSKTIKKDKQGRDEMALVAKRATQAAIGRASVPTVGRGGRTRRPGARIRANKSLLAPKPSERTAYRKAIDLARGSNYEPAAALLLESHRQGDARASYTLATWYIHGRFFDVNPRKAVSLLRKASRAGIREATFDLAHAYEIGFGVAKSPTKAFRYYVEAARKGDIGALKVVVHCVFFGIGFPTSRSLALLIQDLSIRCESESSPRAYRNNKQKK
jgi:hypothetical protein